jgi:hypothetical protein
MEHSTSKRAVDPSFLAEVRGVAVDSIRGDSPTTVLGVIMRNPEGVTIEAVAKSLHIPAEVVLDTVEILEAEDLCERVAGNGARATVMAFAAFSSRNARAYKH